MTSESCIVVPWWELLVVWTSVGAILGVVGALAFGGSPQVGIAIGVPTTALVGAGLELLRRHKEAA